MNERIKDLMGKTLDKHFSYTWTTMDYNDVSKFSEKFAELIVRECARVIDRGDGEMSSQAETIWCNVCRDDILKHFGVKE